MAGYHVAVALRAVYRAQVEDFQVVHAQVVATRVARVRAVVIPLLEAVHTQVAAILVHVVAIVRAVAHVPIVIIHRLVRVRTIQIVILAPARAIRRVRVATFQVHARMAM